MLLLDWESTAGAILTYAQTDHAQGQAGSQRVGLPVSAVLHLRARRST